MPADRRVNHPAACQVAVMRSKGLHQAGPSAAGAGPSSCPGQDSGTSATWAPGGEADYTYLVELVFSHSKWTGINLDQLAMISWRQRCQGDPDAKQVSRMLWLCLCWEVQVPSSHPSLPAWKMSSLKSGVPHKEPLLTDTKQWRNASRPAATLLHLPPGPPTHRHR